MAIPFTFASSVTGGSKIGAGHIQLEGFEELTRKLKMLEGQIQNRILRKALRAGAKPILVKAKANAPVGDISGFADSLGSRTVALGRALGATEKQSQKAAKRAVSHAIRGAKKSGDRYPGQLRDSLKIRAIKRNRAGRIGVVIQTRKGDYRGDTFYGAFVEYGTSKMAAKPYMRPAFDSEKGHSIDIISGVIWTELKRVAALTA